MIDQSIFLCMIGLIYEKRACKLNSKAQNSYFCVKIGLKILTTNLRKQPFAIIKVEY
jgi:hypothetical protein